MYSIASFFAGVGGIDLGFEQTGGFQTIYANEFDKYASETFELNFPTVKVDQRDVHIVPVEDVPRTDVIIGGFPCQAFSIAGYRPVSYTHLDVYKRQESKVYIFELPRR